MATFSVNIPDDKVNELLESFAVTYNYQDNISSVDEEGNKIEIPNTETKADFAKRQVSRYIKDVYKQHQRKKAREEAQAILEANGTNNIDIT